MIFHDVCQSTEILSVSMIGGCEEHLGEKVTLKVGSCHHTTCSFQQPTEYCQCHCDFLVLFDTFWCYMLKEANADNYMILQVTTDYYRLLVVPICYYRLLIVTIDYYRLQNVDTG